MSPDRKQQTRRKTTIDVLSTALEIGEVIYKGGATPIVMFTVGKMVLNLIR